jgi:DHA1 family tetracycline resistance protein-like MFS transporter
LDWFIIGPVLGGVLGHYGARVPFYAAAGLCLLNFLYGYFILPESLDKDKRREFDWKRANPVGSFKFLGKHPEISGLIVSLILIYIAGHAVQSNWSFFTMYKFNWTERMVGISLGVVGFCRFGTGTFNQMDYTKVGRTEKYLLRSCCMLYAYYLLLLQKVG